jgi:hypothetical protein
MYATIGKNRPNSRREFLEEACLSSLIVSYRQWRQRIASTLAATVAVLLLAGCGVTAQVAFRALPKKVSPFAGIPSLLDAQAQALESGDEAGWLAPLDNTQPSLLLRYQELYRSLRAVGVATLTPLVTAADVADATTGPLTLAVGYAYCIQVLVCPTEDLDRGTVAETVLTQITFSLEGDRVAISNFALVPMPANGYGRAPWIDEHLEFLSGARTTVIASADLKSRMPAALSAAEAAATVADQFALWVWPVRYLVYLANPAEWSTWIAKYSTATNVVAYTAAPSASSEVVVVNMALQDTNRDSLTTVLRHEFGHAVTLLGVSRNLVSDEPRIFVEGIAEYIEEDGRPLSSYLQLSLTRRFIHSGRWNGDLDSVEQVYGSDRPEDVLAAYGMGMLFWRCMADRYGRAKLLDFANQVLRQGSRADVAASAALGEPWSTVKATCAAYLRAA